MARRLTAIVVAVLLVSATAGVASTAVLGQTASNQQATTITVSGSGEVAAQPDEAIVFVSVTVTAENASAAASRLARNVSTLRTALNDSNLTAAVRTTDYSLRQRTPDDRVPGPPGQDGQQPVSYVARQSFAVTVPNVSDAGAVIDLAVSSGATEVGGVRFTLSDERRQELREEAIQRAVADAELQARAVAQAANLSLGAIQSIVVGGGDVFGQRVEVAAAANAGTVVEPRQVTVSASVRITYNASAT